MKNSKDISRVEKHVNSMKDSKLKESIQSDIKSKKSKEVLK